MSALSTVIARGSLASRPAAGNSGRVYTVTDSGTSYRDNGSSWDIISPLAVSSMPGTPTTGVPVFRSDLGVWAYHDGTRWLEAGAPSEWTIDMNGGGIAATTAQGFFPMVNGVDLWLVDLRWGYAVSTPHSGTQYWTAELHKYKNGTDTIIATLTSDQATVNPAYVNPASTAIGALTGTDRQVMYLLYTKFSTAGGLVAGTSLRYRRVLT